MRPATAVRDPHQRLIETLQADDSIETNIRLHLVSVTRQDRHQSLGTPVLYRACRAMVLRLYAKALTGNPDHLTLARVCSEAIRAMKSLGMTRPVSRNPAGLFRPVRGKRGAVFTAPATKQPTNDSGDAAQVSDDDNVA